MSSLRFLVGNVHLLVRVLAVGGDDCEGGVEDGVRVGGLGSAVLEYYNAQGSTLSSQLSITLLGLPDAFITHGSVAQLQRDCGIDPEGIARAAKGIEN